MYTKTNKDIYRFTIKLNEDVEKEVDVEKEIEVEKENISIPGKSIKRIGKYQASIRLHREVSTQLNFELLAEKK